MTAKGEFKLVQAGLKPPLDPDFRPAILANRAFRGAVKRSKKAVPLAIAMEAENGTISRYDTQVYASGHPAAGSNLPYVERIVKFLLWQWGGWRVVVGGPEAIGRHISALYRTGGQRGFDADLMGDVYEHAFTVESVAWERVPESVENPRPLGRHLDGCRIGFDLGASDHKVAAVQDGKCLFSEEIVWDPKPQADPRYHHDRILAALKKAAGYLPRVDAIGGSAAGIYINNRVRVASLFRGVPKPSFAGNVREMFMEIRREMGGVPLEVINDGEVTALAGSMSLEANKVLGVAMGSSLAAGYVDGNGNIKGWLDELAFAPVDYDPNAYVDEWSGDKGCGVGYFCQVGVNRLAGKAGIALDATKGLPERLKDVQALMEKGDKKARDVFESIGICFGYAVAHYADFYDFEHLLALGRVTSGAGGDAILRAAEKVLEKEFPEVGEKVKMLLPDEKSRRVGQAIAAASLPKVG